MMTKKTIFLLLGITLLVSSCTVECECEVLENGDIECPC